MGCQRPQIWWVFPEHPALSHRRQGPCQQQFAGAEGVDSGSWLKAVLGRDLVAVHTFYGMGVRVPAGAFRAQEMMTLGETNPNVLSHDSVGSSENQLLTPQTQSPPTPPAASGARGLQLLPVTTRGRISNTQPRCQLGKASLGVLPVTEPRPDLRLVPAYL